MIRKENIVLLLYRSIINSGWLFISPVIHFLASYTMLFTYWPEMLNYPFFLSRGMLPYRDFSMVYTPLGPIFLTYLYQVIGFSGAAMHLIASTLMFVTNMILIAIIYLLTKNKPTTMLAGLLFTFISLAFEGNHIWFDSFLAITFLAVFWLQYSIITKPTTYKILLCGLVLGISLLIKQTTIYIFPTFLVTLAYLRMKRRFSVRELLNFLTLLSLPVILIMAATIAVLLKLAIFNDFVSWTIKFVMELTSMRGGNLTPDLYYPTIKQALTFLPLYATVLYFSVRFRRWEVALAFTWMTTSSLLAYPRFGYFHLQPALAFFFISSFFTLERFKTNKALLAIALSVLVIILSSPVLVRHLKHGDIFLNKEVQEISNWILVTRPEASIYSINGPDLVYALTGKIPSARPWVDQLPWNIAFAGKKYTDGFIASPPDIIVYLPYKLSDYKPEEIIRFIDKNYDTIKTFPSGVKILEKER